MSSIKLHLTALFAMLILTLSGFPAAQPLRAQQPAAVPSALPGNYSGALGPLALKLHITAAPGNTFTGTLDSPSQGAIGIPLAEIKFDGSGLTFEVPAVHGRWIGTFDAATFRLTGTWKQGQPMPLVFTRDALKPSAVDGIWLGTLQPPSGKPLRIQIAVQSDAAGKESCTVDSLDQAATGIPCGSATLTGNTFAFEIPSVEAKYTGTLSSDGKTITGASTQGDATLPLVFTRQASAISTAPPTPQFDPAMPPVAAADLRAVLTTDFATALTSGPLAPATHAGVTIGVIQHGTPYVFSFGTAKPDSIFEIGSISKTFTGLLLVQMIEQHKVILDEPVRSLLPPGTVPKPVGAEITLLDLTTQHSGLPRMPDNFAPANPEDPYADYDSKLLYAFLAKQGVGRPADAGFLYSNLGVGLLGQALASRAGLPYATLLQNQIALPLGLVDTAITLSPAQQSRFIPCFAADGTAAHPWNLDALVGAGGIRSTAADMLKFLEAQLHPEKLTLANGASPGSATLPAAFTFSQQLRSDAGAGTRIAFNWLFDDAPGVYWHNGATGGYTAYAFFNPQSDYAGIVLVNTAIGPNGSLADLIGKHIRARLAGKPAIQLSH